MTDTPAFFACVADCRTPQYIQGYLSSLLTGGKVVVMQAFRFERTKEAPHRRIIPTACSCACACATDSVTGVLSTMKHTLLVGVRILSIESLNIIGAKKKVTRDHIIAIGEHKRAESSSALKRAGIENFRWHDLRHTWASWLVQNGTPLYDLQEMGAWKSSEMVRRYAHLAPAQMAKHAAIVGSLLNVTNTAQGQK